MTHAIDTTSPAPSPFAARVDVPELASWVVRRPGLAKRLDGGVSGPLTLVTGPTGSGKTMAVASWAHNGHRPGPVVWSTAAGADGDLDFFLGGLRTKLAEAGLEVPAHQPGRRRARGSTTHVMTDLGLATRGRGPFFVVIDDYPTGPVGPLGEELALLLRHAQRAIRLVVISRGEPAIETHRHHAAGDLTRLTGADLAMDAHEVAGVLAGHGVEASELTARVVERRTSGWPCGVRLTAAALLRASTVEEALEESDRAAADYLAAEVLEKCPAAVRELLVRTSVVGEVTPKLARAVMGHEVEVTAEQLAQDGLVEVREDGSFRCHPLLRSAARRQLMRAPARLAEESRGRAARWYADNGDLTRAVALGTALEDSRWLARVLVDAYAVPKVLAGGTHVEMHDALGQRAVREAEPLLQAAADLRDGNPAGASAALVRARALAATRPATPVDRISEIFVTLALARAGGDLPDEGVVAEARALVAQLPAPERAELTAQLDAVTGAIAMGRGQVHEAAAILRRTAFRPRDGAVPDDIRLECVGQLALVEAFRGNLAEAESLATAVLDESEAAVSRGTAHAEVAMAWVGLERSEPAEVRGHLDRAVTARGIVEDPWMSVAVQIGRARLLILNDMAEAALRLLSPAVRAAYDRPDPSSWPADELTVVLAETLLAVGEPRRALALLDPPPVGPGVGAGVIAASAYLDSGDLAASRAALAEVSSKLASGPLSLQVEAWLVEASLAQHAGQPEDTHLLVDRALRTATTERLRRPFAHRAAWLATTVDRDPVLRRGHGAFLSGVRPAAFRQPGRNHDAAGPTFVMVEVLTQRETEVLALLAQMCSTVEIADELFLSVNTVKTYVRGILRKLGVKGRVDAVRQGRDLGLC